MRQQHLNSAVARVTGESLRTIQQRGFGLVRLDSDRPARRGTSASASAGPRSRDIEPTAEDFLRSSAEV